MIGDPILAYRYDWQIWIKFQSELPFLFTQGQEFDGRRMSFESVTPNPLTVISASRLWASCCARDGLDARGQ